MAGLSKEIQSLGWSLANFCRKAEVSYLTLKRLEAGRTVRPETRVRVERTLESIRTAAKAV